MVGPWLEVSFRWRYRDWIFPLPLSFDLFPSSSHNSFDYIYNKSKLPFAIASYYLSNHWTTIVRLLPPLSIGYRAQSKWRQALWTGCFKVLEIDISYRLLRAKLYLKESFREANASQNVLSCCSFYFYSQDHDSHESNAPTLLPICYSCCEYQ